MKKFFRISCLLIIALLSFSISGCDDISSMLAINKEALAQTLTDQRVINSINLPIELEDGSTISWESSDTSVISNEGVVQYSSGLSLSLDGVLSINDAIRTATLTGTISKGKTKDTYSFTISAFSYSEEENKIFKAYSAIMTAYEGIDLSAYILDLSSGKAEYSYEFIAYEGVDIEYKDSTHIDFTGNKAVVIRPTEEKAVTDNVEVVLSLGSISYTVTVPVRITKDEANYLTLAQLRDEMDKGSKNYEGVTYVYSGTITEFLQVKTLTTLYIQDGEEAIQIYGYTGKTALELGDYILVTSTVTDYNGLYETKKVSNIQIITKAEDNSERIAAIQTLAITKENFNYATMQGKDNILVSVDKAVFLGGGIKKGDSLTIGVGIDGIISTVYVNKYADDYDNIYTFFNGLVVGDLFKISKCTLGMYKKDPQFNVNTSSCLSKADGTLKDIEKAKYELAKFTFASQLNSGDVVDLQLVGAYFKEIGFKYKASSDKIVIADGKLTVNSNEATTFDLTVTAYKGITESKITIEGIKVFSPTPLSEIIAKIDSETSIDGLVLSGKILASGTDYAIIENGGKIVKLVYEGEITSPLEGSTIVTAIKSGVKENGAYTLTISSITVDNKVQQYQGGKFTTVSEIATDLTDGLELQKVVLKNVTVADGALVSEGLTISFFTNAKLKTPVAYADGTYDYLEGFIFASSNTAVAFYVTSTWNNMAKVLEAGASSTVYTLRGVFTVRTGASSAYLTDEDGNTICVYVSGLKYELSYNGVYAQVKGTITEYDIILEICPATAKAPDVIGVNIYAPYDFVPGLKKRAIEIDEVGSNDAVVTNKEIIFSGLTYVSVDQEKIPTSTTSTTFKFKDKSNNEFLLYFNYAVGLDELLLAYEKLDPAIKNPAGYTISAYGVYTKYTNEETNITDYEIYPSACTIVLTPVAA